jgi:hypothetical protein
VVSSSFEDAHSRRHKNGIVTQLMWNLMLFNTSNIIKVSGT